LDVLLFAVTPGWLAYGLFMWVQRFIAGYFVYRQLKDSLELDTLPSLYGGLAYSLFAQTTFDFVYSAGFHLYDGLGLPGLPFILWALDHLEVNRKYRPFFYSAGLGVLLSISSYFYFTLFFIRLFFCWFILVRPKREPKFWGFFALFVMAWLVSAWPVLWSSLLNAPLSHRVDWTPDAPIPVVPKWAGQVAQLIQLARDNIAALGLFAVGLAVSLGRD
jgi:hypothetical protein